MPMAVTPGQGGSVATESLSGGRGEMQLMTDNGPQGIAKTSQVLIGTSRLPMPAANLGNRKFVGFYNDGTATIYVGGSTVTTSGSTKGIPIRPGDGPLWFAGTVVWYGISDGINQAMIVTECN